MVEIRKRRYLLLLGGIGSVWGGAGWYLVVMGQYRAVRVDSWFDWVTMKRNWLMHDNTGSVEGGTGWYLVVLGQYRAVRVDIWCYWVSMKRNWLIHDNIGSVKGGAGSVWGCTGWYLVVLGQSYLVLSQKNLVLIGIKWNWVSTRLLCLYILKKSGDLVGCHHGGTTNERTNKDRATQSIWTMDGWDEQKRQ